MFWVRGPRWLPWRRLLGNRLGETRLHPCVAVGVFHSTSAVETGSPHALCPFGAVESLWSLLVGGRYLPKIHASSIRDTAPASPDSALLRGLTLSAPVVE